MYYSVRRQLYTINLFKNVLVKLLLLKLTLTLKHLNLSRFSQLYYSTLKRLSKVALALIPLSLLPYSVNTQALLASTIQVINGSAPYLTFDNGVTKVTTAEGLLWITLSNGTHITPAINTSATTAIVLPNAGETLADVQMLVPTTANSIALNDLISAPYNYWGDDDGDGQGTNGITATGNLSVSITDKDNQAVSRSASLDLCKAPYKLQLTSTDVSLTTQYGVPNSSNFTGNSATYYISPKAVPTICYAMPNLTYGTGDKAGPATIWNPTKGFLVQSTEPSSYSRNFPTTGANNVYFDLEIGGVNGSALTWPTVSQGGITATMTPSPDNANNIRVTLTGPAATESQISSATPGSVATPSLPQTFVLVGKDSSNSELVSYGFVLKHWFVNRGTKRDTYAPTSSWCSSLGYRLPQVKDLTNAKCGVDNRWFPCVNGIDGATPSSTVNYYQRNIGAGLFTEWGYMHPYTDAGFFYNYYWTSDSNGSNQFNVYSLTGDVVKDGDPSIGYNAVCAYP
ncbi:hypothetical protein A9G13_10615 [Gilliamella sp. wkB178]|uniref:hypothetical protein n=1 Tax=Gilliamella sp. wkB178 TaxID=3120259 RepID=UPI00080EDEB8|nr:hypothetical protein [Gilliamella apicola]OCG06701.1 hypothetical protein A9G13_10615 [Gilliamella apicola]